ncbi:MAG: DUF3619 family protein [Burkholderiales bacterium]|nr:MAG: DUF3619 family protein [Burkholderiales bacterium]
MTDEDVIRTARAALDASAARVPERVATRLAAARARAIEARRTPERAPAAARASLPIATPAPGRALSEFAPLFGWRRVAALLPMVLIVLALVVSDAWRDRREAEEVAQVEVDLLTDELPIAAYADRGFGVYVVNMRR